MRGVLVLVACCACGDREPDARSSDPPSTMEMASMTSGAHPGPVALPSERMAATMIDPRLLEDSPPTMADPFSHEAPLDLSIIEDE